MSAPTPARRTVCRALNVTLLAACLPVAALYAAGDSLWVRLTPSEHVTLRNPRDLSLSPEKLLYIADTGHHRVLALDLQGNIVHETGGLGSAHGQFQWPSAVVADRGNAVWILDYGNRRIEKFTRSLEYQGTLEIPITRDDPRHQLAAFAVSPLGDVYVYDGDAGRIVRFDPLFTLQAQLGSGGGPQFVASVADMVFVSGRGLVWWERGRKHLRCADALLNAAPHIPLPGSPDEICLAARDSCLIVGSLFGVQALCGRAAHFITLVDSAGMKQLGITRLAAVALTAENILFLLDGATGVLYCSRQPCR